MAFYIGTSLTSFMFFLQDKLTCSFANQSILPSYTVFKAPFEKVYSSTQLEAITNTHPSTSKEFNFASEEKQNKSLKKDIEELKKKFQEKEGEVSILRFQLNESKNNFHVEQEKVQNELKKKLTISDKHVQSARSELEFKVCV